MYCIDPVKSCSCYKKEGSDEYDDGRWDQTMDGYRLQHATIVLNPSVDTGVQLNPIENIWQYLRQNGLSNRAFDTYDDSRRWMRCLEQAHRPATDNHFNRNARVGAQRSELNAIGIKRNQIANQAMLFVHWPKAVMSRVASDRVPNPSDAASSLASRSSSISRRRLRFLRRWRL